MRRSRLGIVLFALAVAVSCGDGRVLGPEARKGSELPPESPAPPSFAISDALHEGGNPHFFWLPPMVADPEAFNGDFDAGQSPAVRICDLTDCAANEIAAYTMDAGLGSEVVRVVTADAHYIVNWHTDESSATPGPTYRITVSVAGTEIGYADVVLGTSGKDAKNLTTNETIGLKDGRTLPIKFRIEEGAVFAIDPVEGGTIDALDGTATIEVPAGAVSEETGFTVESEPAVDEQLQIIELGPDGLTFPDDNPVVVTLTYDESALGGIPEEDLALNTFEDGEWIVVPGFELDLQNNTASAPFYHFSKASIGPAEKAAVCSTDGNPHTFGDIQGALDAVIDGGTVSICGETQVVDSVRVAKAVTIEGRGGARPVIRTTTARASLFVDEVPSGSVTIRGIDFENQSPRDTSVQPDKNTYSVRIQGTFDRVLVENSTFESDPGTTGGLIVIGSAAVPGAHVDVRDNTFNGGIVGMNANWVSSVDLYGNSFGVHDWYALLFFHSKGRIEAGTFVSGCGGTDCVRLQGSGTDATVVGNSFTEDRTTTNPDTYEVIWARSSSVSRIEDNDFDGCGAAACIRATGGSAIDIVNNTFTIHSSHGTTFAVVGTDGSGGTRVPLYAPPTLTVTDNVITGMGTDQAGYATVHSAIHAEWGAMLSAHRNTITNMATGISAYGAPGVITDATNNVIDNVGTGIGVWNGTRVSASFNDITTVSGNQIDIPDSDPTLSDLTCNWWGDANGPSTISGGVPTTIYTPFAGAPIANTGATSC